jgi:benzylsuccinate CoA-transferase BbsF subunit
MNSELQVPGDKPILQNIRILDFSWVLAGPYATRLLADFGAEVIKVQPALPGASDKFSQGYYQTWNRNKLSLTLDLRQPDGIQIAKKLAAISDAVVENFSPRVMANWGLDYPELKKLKPDILFLSLSVMGHTGSLRDYTGFGPSVQAFSGFTSLTGYPDQPPLGAGYSYADHVAGLYASLALLGALEYRRRTGKGQYIDLSETETMSSLLSDSILSYTQQGQVPAAAGNRSFRAAPQGVYRCRGEDRWCAITVSTEVEWEAFKRAIGNPAWASDPAFSDLPARRENVSALDIFVQDWTRERTPEDVMTALQREGVPAGVVQNAADLAHDPQLKARGFFIELDHPSLGKTPVDASPIRLSSNPAKYRRPAPNPGEDSDYVCRQILGLSEDEVGRLRQNNIIPDFPKIHISLNY